MKKKFTTSSLLLVLINGAYSSFVFANEGARLYGYSGVEFENQDNNDGKLAFLSKQVFMDGVLVLPESDWSLAIFAASWQLDKTEQATTNKKLTISGKDIEIRPTYEATITNFWNIGNEFAYIPGTNGDTFRVKPFTLISVNEKINIYAETLWALSAGGRSSFNENLFHPMYKLTNNLTIGLEFAYNQGLKNDTHIEIAIRPNMSYQIDEHLSVWGKIEIGKKSDQKDASIDGEYIKYAIGYNKRLNETFTLVNELSLFNWDDNLINTGGNNIFFKVGLAY